MNSKFLGAGIALHVFPSLSTVTIEGEEPDVARCKVPLKKAVLI
jgi:hypothetical protein